MFQLLLDTLVAFVPLSAAMSHSLFFLLPFPFFICLFICALDSFLSGGHVIVSLPLTIAARCTFRVLQLVFYGRLSSRRTIPCL